MFLNRSINFEGTSKTLYFYLKQRPRKVRALGKIFLESTGDTDDWGIALVRRIEYLGFAAGNTEQALSWIEVRNGDDYSPA